MHEKKITITSEINAHIDYIWQCWTQPEHITKWNFASDDWHCPDASNNLTVGGIYKARMEARNGSFAFDFIAKYDEIIEKKLLRYTIIDDGRNVTTHFIPKSGKIIITTIFDAEKENPEEMQRKGWQAILNNFKKYVESA
ncbi:MAG: SRPBCC domain-containing protein [Deltaproteobacteria bacterium]|nr:SRPBCC domain-containing protein [Deltaproteobacteria bacterium]